MYKTLIIGCGNIGALYDFENGQVLTHAKAFFLSQKAELHFFDLNETLLNKVANKYQAIALNNIDNVRFEEYDIICICTPTFTHKIYLERALAANVKLIICEKPISVDIAEIDYLLELYKSSSSKVLVNYFRRFQPAYSDLKSEIGEILKYEELTNISIRTQRGFINNTSHAFDLIQYLFNDAIELKNVLVHNCEYDQFDSDPTLSLQATWNKTNFSLQGLSNVRFSFFEIDLFFTQERISIQNAGKDVLRYKAEESNLFLKPLVLIQGLSKTDCTSDYMSNVVDYSFKLLCENSIFEDNFIETVNLNKLMLTILYNSNGKTGN